MSWRLVMLLNISIQRSTIFKVMTIEYAANLLFITTIKYDRFCKVPAR